MTYEVRVRAGVIRTSDATAAFVLQCIEFQRIVKRAGTLTVDAKTCRLCRCSAVYLFPKNSVCHHNVSYSSSNGSRMVIIINLLISLYSSYHPPCITTTPYTRYERNFALILAGDLCTSSHMRLPL